ncbi:hypothetical protein [Paenibacillus campi]|uniref:hypothetical protein n=1 Tax=Paenibacillus campi TaxID=3106031 RepID=UPI002AFE4C20|nr:hypothetical protein [Paenibacillus sp. SGZ-1014]
MFTLINGNADYVGADLHNHTHEREFPLYSKASFATVEKYLEVFDSRTRSLLVYFGDRELIADLIGERKHVDLGAVFRELQQYTVNVYESEFQTLEREGYVQPLFDGQVLI